MKNNLDYTGKVTVTLGRRRITALNRGTDELFTLFARALVGSNVSNVTPDKFKIMYPGDTDNKEILVSIQRRTVEGTSAIFAGYLTTAIPANTTPVTIELCKGTTIYAAVELDSMQIGALTGITSEKSALIEWELTVSNPTNL